MKQKTKSFIPILSTILILLAWSPWLTDDYIKSKVKEDENFIRQHIENLQQQNPDIYVAWIPFGRLVSTYEGNWIIAFYGKIIL